MSAPASRKLHYAWVVAAVTFIALIAGAAVRSVPGILIVPLEHEFGPAWCHDLGNTFVPRPW